MDNGSTSPVQFFLGAKSRADVYHGQLAFPFVSHEYPYIDNIPYGREQTKGYDR